MAKNSGQFIKHHFHDENFFEKDTEECWYWAGFIAADGSVSKKTTLNISICSLDLDHLKQFQKNIKTTVAIKLKPPRSTIFHNKIFHSKEQCEISIYSKKIVNDLTKWNIVPNKTTTYKIPDELLTHPLIRHFIRGMIDGDGSWIKIKNKEQRTVLSMCGTKEICTQIYNVFKQKNLISSRMNVYKSSISEICYYIQFCSQKDLKKIREFLYHDASIFLDRKYQIALRAHHEEKFEPNSVLLENLYAEHKSIKNVANLLKINEIRVKKLLLKNNIVHDCLRKNFVNENFFENQKISLYWLGYFVKKIHIEHDRIIVIHDSKEKLEKINLMFDSTYKINGTELRFGSVKLVKDFNNLVKTKLIELNNIEEINEFLLGYIESSGNFARFRSCYLFKITDRIYIIEIIKKILFKMGIIWMETEALDFKKSTNKSLIINNDNALKLFKQIQINPDLYRRSAKIKIDNIEYNKSI